MRSEPGEPFGENKEVLKQLEHFDFKMSDFETFLNDLEPEDQQVAKEVMARRLREAADEIEGK